VTQLKELALRGKVRIIFRSHLVSVSRRAVILQVPTGQESLENDAVLVLIGGVPSWDLLTRSGVKLLGQLSSDEREEILFHPGP
jgi:hypothetical protein